MGRDVYPDAPGRNWRDTSIAAADQVTESASTLREAVYALFAGSATLTTHECANLLRRHVSSVQPRVSELAAKGRIVDSGERRRNETSGKRAIAWKLPSAQLNLL